MEAASAVILILILIYSMVPALITAPLHLSISILMETIVVHPARIVVQPVLVIRTVSPVLRFLICNTICIQILKLV